MKNDGVYYIEFSEYLTNFEETVISTDNSGWSQAAFVKLGDKSSIKPSHTLTVTSATDQRVWISDNTWEWRGQSDSCHHWDTEHLI